MPLLLFLLQILAGIGSLVCFILVLVRLFQDGQTGLGVACIVLILCGVGPLIAFIVGWVNAQRWRMTNVMTFWTVCIVVGVLAGAIRFATLPPGEAFKFGV
jgi:hypothetical protein